MDNTRDITPTLATLAVEAWRMQRVVEGMTDVRGSMTLRHALRRILGTLTEEGVHIHDLTGRPYDPGLAVDVLDVEVHPDLAPDQQRIHRTVRPLVMGTWGGTQGLLVRGEVVVATGPASPRRPARNPAATFKRRPARRNRRNRRKPKSTLSATTPQGERV